MRVSDRKNPNLRREKLSAQKRTRTDLEGVPQFAGWRTKRQHGGPGLDKGKHWPKAGRHTNANKQMLLSQIV